ncbi:MAG: hypothetical protein KKB20_08045 [Proteobacteria bacterium]|nr:hypothetical protein [Pseudomonadota bacterium]
MSGNLETWGIQAATGEEVRSQTNRFGLAGCGIKADKGAPGTITTRVRAHLRNIGGKRVRVKAHTRRRAAGWRRNPPEPVSMFRKREDAYEILSALTDYLLGTRLRQGYGG